jgi:hypothetical protein
VTLLKSWTLQESNISERDAGLVAVWLRRAGCKLVRARGFEKVAKHSLIGLLRKLGMLAHRETLAEKRPLTNEEKQLLRWLLNNGNPGSDSFIPQIDRALVTAKCNCGCASIYLTVDDRAKEEKAGWTIVSDYQWRSDSGNLCGIMVFAQNNFLILLDLWSIDGVEVPAQLPDPTRLVRRSESIP